MVRFARRQVLQGFIAEKKVGKSQWLCCEETYTTNEAMGRHVHMHHSDTIDNLETAWQPSKPLSSPVCHESESALPQPQRRTAKGASDPIHLECVCDRDRGSVILFYLYQAVADPEAYVASHRAICERLALTGKVRIASEGINATLAGDKAAIASYLDWVVMTEPFATRREQLQDAKILHDFFKPSRGCHHVFPDLSIRHVPEICPLGQPLLASSSVSLQSVDVTHKKLGPAEFHAWLESPPSDMVLLDTRNYYESRIGQFKGAITPAIRKFSRLPDYVDRNRTAFAGKKVLTYCTGGVRCEKATAYLRQTLSDDTDVYMLDGGIHNYLEWWQQQPKEVSAQWQGKNYVFDARQALGADRDHHVVGACQQCDQPWDAYRKCAGPHCHLLVLRCDKCCLDGQPTYCCSDCPTNVRIDGVCGCEHERRQKEHELLQL